MERSAIPGMHPYRGLAPCRGAAKSQSPPNANRATTPAPPAARFSRLSARAHQQTGDIVVPARLLGGVHHPRAQFFQPPVEAQERLNERVGELAGKAV